MLVLVHCQGEGKGSPCNTVCQSPNQISSMENMLVIQVPQQNAEFALAEHECKCNNSIAYHSINYLAILNVTFIYISAATSTSQSIVVVVLPPPLPLLLTTITLSTDIPVMDIEKSVEVEGTSGNKSSVKDSVLCMDGDSSDEKSSKECIVYLDDTTDDDSLHLAATSTIQNNCTDPLSTISTTEHNSTDQQPLTTTTTTVVASPNASVNTSTITSSIVTSKPQQKRQLEDTFSPCKRLCILDS